MFITLEGPEGSGKSSQARALATLLERTEPVTLTREPGGTPLGEQVRSLLFAPGTVAAEPVAELLLFSAARAQLVGEVIAPALRRGEIVVCDRFADSTRAYQGGGLGVEPEQVELAIRLATGGLEPDLTILLDIEAEHGLRRRTSARGDEGGGEMWNSFDARALAFHERVRRAYLQLALDAPQRIAVVDAARPFEAVARDVRALVAARLRVRVS